MAESMVQAASQQNGKAKAKTRTTSSHDKTPSKENRELAKSSSSSSNAGNPSEGTSSTATLHSEMVSILTEIRNNQKSQENKLLVMESKISSLEEGYEQDYFEYEDAYPDEGTSEMYVSQTQSNDANNNVDKVVPSAFKDLGSKYNVQENLDMEVDDELASITTVVYREGLTEEKFKTLVTEIGRPSNCPGLTKTKVNNVIWNLLSPEMHSADGKMQAIQDGVVKAGTVLVKLLNLANDRLSIAELEMGTDALGLLGHTNKLINNRRKSMHKKELNQEYHHLCSQSRSYSDLLYGDDVGKDVKEIQDINRIGSKIKNNYYHQNSFRGRGNRGYPRGVYRGRVGKFRGKGRGGFRPKNPQGVYNMSK